MTDQSLRHYAADLLNRAGAVFDHEDVLLVASIIPLIEADLIIVREGDCLVIDLPDPVSAIAGNERAGK